MSYIGSVLANQVIPTNLGNQVAGLLPVANGGTGNSSGTVYSGGSGAAGFCRVIWFE